MAPQLLSQQEIEQRLAELNPAWTGTTAELQRSIEFADFPTAAEFINRLVPACEDLDHHPDLALRWRWVDIVLTTHSIGGVTDVDFTLASHIDEIAAMLPQAA